MKVLILASHPVQYHAPVFRRVAQLLSQAGHQCIIVYLSDFSVRGYRDPDFSVSLAWDEPLLAGYQSRILNPNSTEPPRGFCALNTPDWSKLLRQEMPDRLLVTTLNYQGTVTGVLRARQMGIPCTLRVETNDAAMVRSKWKDNCRSFIYKHLYTLFDSAIAIGTLNQQHLVKHGIPASKIGMAYYCVSDRFASLSLEEKLRRRQALRQQLDLEDRDFAILFCGKLIPKKNPQLLLEALTQLPEPQQKRIALLYVGSGAMERELRAIAAEFTARKIHFAGFKNQLEIAPYYLATDALVLPSKRQGETWGLVVNEALQAGLPCIVTSAVGCAADFARFPHFQVIPAPDPNLLAEAIGKITHVTRDFERYSSLMQEFSVDRCSEAIANFLTGDSTIQQK